MNSKKYLFFTLLLIIFCLAADPRPSLLVPGTSAGIIVLGEKVEQVFRLFPSSSFERVRHDVPKSLFVEIFGLSVKKDILFDEIYYYTKSGTIIFCLERTMVAIIVTYRDITLEGGGSLERNISNVLFNFGNEGLAVLKKDSDTVYLFRQRGVALFDDKSDGRIDMAAVFLP